MNNINDIPVSRKKLDEFIADIQKLHPRINFDTSILDKYSEYWFLDILTDSSLKDELKRDSIEGVYEAILAKYREGKGVEKNQGIYDRVQILKDSLKQFINPEGKVLVVTHSRVLQSFSSKGVRMAQGPVYSSVGPDELIEPRYYNNCEIVPYYIE